MIVNTMWNVIYKYLSGCCRYCKLCKKRGHLINTCQTHYWCKTCNDCIKDYYGRGAHDFCFLCRNHEWCKKIHNALCLQN